MDVQPVDRGSKRRVAVRAIVGKPGSLRRWILVSLVILAAALLLFGHADFLGRIATFILATVLITAAFRARSIVVGDEDEFHAALRREWREGWEPADSDEESFYIDDEEWERVQEILRDREYGSIGAPPTPVLEDSDSTKRDEGVSTGGESV